MDREGISNEASAADKDPIQLNVGGRLFETTLATIRFGGPDSLLYALSTRSTADQIFIDRDPEIFSVLLSLLRSGRLSSTARRFSKQELAEEALYYGIDSCLRAAISPPAFSGIDATKVSTVRLASDGQPCALSAGDDGSIWVGHGGQISSFDWALLHTSTVRTHLESVSSLQRVLPEVAAVASESEPGLHLYDLGRSRQICSINWTDPTDPRIYKACVTSITDSPSHIYAAFECPHKENVILFIDKATLQVVSEIGRQSGNSTKIIVPTKLTWMPETGTVVGSAVTCGAFGYSGYVRIWDPRTGSIIWETNEPGSGRSSRFGDSFADVEVDTLNSLLFKVCSKSGDVAMADMRNLRDDPWVYLKDRSPSMNLKVGETSLMMHCYHSQIFVARDGALEVWSKLSSEDEMEYRIGEDIYRRNFVDKEEDSLRGIIKGIASGGNRLFISRHDMEDIEVWESSRFSGVIQIP